MPGIQRPPGARHIRFRGRPELLRSQAAGVQCPKPGPTLVPTAHKSTRLERDDSVARPSYWPFKDSLVDAEQPHLYELERSLSSRLVPSGSGISGSRLTLLFCRQRGGHDDLDRKQRVSTDTTGLIRCRRHQSAGPQNGKPIISQPA
jgi:hypothetical protein